MKLVIKFPTRGRPEKFLKTLDTYLRFLDDKKTEFIISCDNDDTSMTQDFVLDYINQYDNIKLFYGDNKTKIGAVNANLDNVEFDIVLLASDDMIPIVKGFDTIIKNKMLEYYPDTDGILFFNDGYQGNKLNTLCILGGKYYNRFGYIYYPEYKSICSDNEFMEVGYILNRQTYFNEIIIQHQHPDWGYGKNDTIYNLNSTNGPHDINLYNKRKHLNFGL